MTDEQRVDLSALDPDAKAGAEERFVRAVMGRVAERPKPDGLGVDPLIGVWSLMRSPALAAGLLIAVTLGALGLRIKSETATAPVTVAQAIGVPAEFLASAPSGR